MYSEMILWMEEILHQLLGGKHPMIFGCSTIPGGAGFLSSTVSCCQKLGYPKSFDESYSPATRYFGEPIFRVKWWMKVT